MGSKRQGTRAGLPEVAFEGYSFFCGSAKLPSYMLTELAQTRACPKLLSKAAVPPWAPEARGEVEGLEVSQASRAVGLPADTVISKDQALVLMGKPGWARRLWSLVLHEACTLRAVRRAHPLRSDARKIHDRADEVLEGTRAAAARKILRDNGLPGLGKGEPIDDEPSGDDDDDLRGKLKGYFRSVV